SIIVMYEKKYTYVVESSPRSISVRKANVCTNHFEKLTDENRRYLIDSYQPLEAMQHQQKVINDAEQAFRLLNDTDRGGSSDQYKNWTGTIHTSAYSPKRKQAWFALRGDREPFVIDFSAWLKGKNLKTNRIWGEVNTELPFAHTDEGVR